MKYVKDFSSFRKSKPVNEELLGGLLNWFKKMWDKAVTDIQKLENDPNVIKDWVIKNALNPTDDTNVFSQVLKEFEKKPTANDQDCLTLVDNLLDPETGSLGKQGVGVLLSNKSFQGEELKAKRAMLEYIINTARNQTIAKVKFAGGPTDGKVDPKKKNVDLKDTTHLPDLKKLLAAQKDEAKKKTVADDWVKKTMIPMIQNFVKAIKEDDIRASLKKQGIDMPEGADYKEGDSVIYKRDKFNEDEWGKITDEDKKKPTEGPIKDMIDKQMIGVDKIEKVEGDNITFKDNAGKDFTKTKEDILSKSADEKGPNAQELAKTLGEIKADEDKMKQMNTLAGIVKDPEANKDKMDQPLSKIIGGDEAK
jgi:hypothetical protein